MVAPAKFKGTLTADEVADAIAGVVSEVIPGADVALVPMADGGEGTARIIGRCRGYVRSSVECFDPLMRPSVAEVWISPDRRSALIDSSAVIGLSLVDPDLRDPWRSTSYGLGYAAEKLLQSGITHLEIGIGGTATIDAGLGFLQALGAVIYTSDDGARLDHVVTAADLNSITSVDVTSVKKYAALITGISDVDVPLYAPDGHSSMLMFAPQKGVGTDNLDRLSAALQHLIHHVEWTPCIADFNKPYGGAGGGLGFAIGTVLGSTIVPGAATVIDACRVFEPRPDLVITGEGRFDDQSLTGKLTGAIIRRCHAEGIACRVIAGSVEGTVPAEVYDASRYAIDQQLSRAEAITRVKRATAEAVFGFIRDNNS